MRALTEYSPQQKVHYQEHDKQTTDQKCGHYLVYYKTRQGKIVIGPTPKYFVEVGIKGNFLHNVSQEAMATSGDVSNLLYIKEEESINTLLCGT